MTHNVHAPRGIHAHKDASGAWEWMVQDGLGSVRGVVDNSVGVLESRNYDPYGELFGATGSSQTSYGFTGEQTDGTGLVYLRNRYYNPAAGVFTALDPLELLNRYSYVNGNPINFADPSGLLSNCATIPDFSAAVGCVVQTCGSNPATASSCIAAAGVAAPIAAAAASVLGVAVVGSAVLTPVAYQYIQAYENYVTGTADALTDAYIQGLMNQAAQNNSESGGLTAAQWAAIEQGLQQRQQLAAFAQLLSSNVGALNPQQPGFNPNEFWRLCNSGLCGTALLILLSQLTQIIPLDLSRTRVNKQCNPSAALAWKHSLPVRSIAAHVSAGNPPYLYQLQVTHDYNEYHATDGVVSIWADSIRESDCTFIDAKFISKPWASPFTPGSSFPSKIVQPMAEFIWEVARYTYLINDPSIPIVGLEVHTNEPLAALFFQAAMLVTPGGRVVVH